MRVLKVISCAIMCVLILLSSCFYVFAAETPTEPETTNPNFKLGFNYDGAHFNPVDFSMVPESYTMCVYQRSTGGQGVGTLCFYDPAYFEFHCYVNPDNDSEHYYGVRQKSYSTSTGGFKGYYVYNSALDHVTLVTSASTNGGFCSPYVYNYKPEIVFSANFECNVDSRFTGTKFSFEPTLFSNFIKNAAIGWNGKIPDAPDSDNPDRPEGDYKYAVYEFQSGDMTMAQYFTAKPEVYQHKVGSMTQYEILVNRYKNETGDTIDRQSWEFWMPENTTYFWNVKKNTFTKPDKTPATYDLFKNYPTTDTVIKFSWKPFDDYSGEIFDADPALPGVSDTRPTGKNFPYVVTYTRNGEVVFKHYFEKQPYLIAYRSTSSQKVYYFVYQNCIAEASNGAGENPEVSDYRSWKRPPGFAKFYDNTSYVEYVDTKTYKTYDENYIDVFEYVAHTEATATYNVTFNFKPTATAYEVTGEDDDFIYDDHIEDDDGFTDENGNKHGGAVNDESEKSDTLFPDSGFEFNGETLWKYANEFLNFCANTFAVLPSFIWQIVATGFVIVVILRILGR